MEVKNKRKSRNSTGVPATMFSESGKGVYKIYKLGNKSNPMLYVGVTTLTLTRRLREHFMRAKNINSVSKLSVAIREIGESSFYIIELATATTPIEAYSKEVEFISKMNSKENGYNSLVGGGGIGGIDENDLALITKKDKIKKRPPYKEGRIPPSTKISKENRIKVIELLKTKRQFEVAAIFKVDPSTISKIVASYKKNNCYVTVT